MTRFGFALFAVTALAAAPLATGCSSSSGTAGNDGGLKDMDAGKSPCQVDPPAPECGQSCTMDDDCPNGFFCDGDMCTAQCGSTGGCPATHTCNADTGRCEPVSGPCASATPPPSCGDTCVANHDCDAPLSCLGSICTAECNPGTTEYCDAGEVCDDFGFCKPGQVLPDGGKTDGGNCPDINVTADPVVPTVILIVDRSGSMDSSFGTTDRWTAATNALVGTNGVVTNLGGIVRFGLVPYTATNGGNDPVPAIGTCPDIRGNVAPSLTSANDIEQSFMDWLPDEDTPTGDTMTYVTNTWLSGFSQVDKSDDTNWTWQGDPIVYVLATDGEPDSCANGDPTGGSADAVAARQSVIDAATEARNHGIDTYVISVAVSSGTQSHLDAVAAAGGTGTATAANNPDALSTALQSVVTGQISCDLTLKGEIQDPSTVCDDGTIRLTAGGTTSELTCQGSCSSGGSEGWCLVDGTHVRILGSACQTLKSGQSVTVNGTFACGTVICPAGQCT